MRDSYQLTKGSFQGVDIDTRHLSYFLDLERGDEEQWNPLYTQPKTFVLIEKCNPDISAVLNYLNRLYLASAPFLVLTCCGGNWNGSEKLVRFFSRELVVPGDKSQLGRALSRMGDLRSESYESVSAHTWEALYRELVRLRILDH